MQTMERYLELVDNGRTCDQEISLTSVRQALLALHTHAVEHDGLSLEGAWRLDAGACRRLEQQEGYVPPGGWRGLAALSAGCGVLKAGRDGFLPASSTDDLVDWDATDTTRHLLEAFTRRLVPPTTAAGLFILLGIHPAWGVHLAHKANQQPRGAQSGNGPGARRRKDLFPDKSLAIVEDAVFSTIGTIVSTLRQLEPTDKYPVDALAGLVEVACKSARQRAETQLGDDVRGLAPFVDVSDPNRSESNWRVIDFTTSDLIDALLVPAGAAHRFNDDTFCVLPHAFDDVKVGSWDADTQDKRLTRALTDAPDCQVA